MNYTLLHLHSDYSLLDSTTKFEQYVDWAVSHGMTAIASTEHGNIYNWTSKKLYCDKKGIKYIHGIEMYLTAKLYHKKFEAKEGEVVETPTKIKDNYHVVLLAKNEKGIEEINQLVSISSDAEHFYFKPRISFDEFFGISDNVIKISACVANPIWSIQYQVNKMNLEYETNKNELESLKKQLESLIAEQEQPVIRKKKKSEKEIQKQIAQIKIAIEAIEKSNEVIVQYIDELNSVYPNLLKTYDYYEVQPHMMDNQIALNKQLIEYSKQYNKPLICGTDTHSLDDYMAECRTILQEAKGIEFLDEDSCDLTIKTYDELYDMFVQQGVLSKSQIMRALLNTNKVADEVEDFKLDMSFKYPEFTSSEQDALDYENKCYEGLEDKIQKGFIKAERKEEYLERVKTEVAAMKKVNMMGFMLSMSNFIGDLRKKGIPFGNGRGSAGGCECAYLTDITDCDPIIWGLSFERFCNENRVSLGDIDIDCRDEDEDLIIKNIEDTVGIKRVAHVFALGTNQILGAIDDVARALARRWELKNGKSDIELKRQKREIQRTVTDKKLKKQQLEEIKEKIDSIKKHNDKLNNPWSLNKVKEIKALYNTDPEECRKLFPELFHFVDGLVDVNISASIHPAGVIVANEPLDSTYGIMINDGKRVCQLDMDAAHDINLVKYDILKLKSVKILKYICDMLGEEYPESATFNWNDKAVWDSLAEDNTAIPQYESNFAGQLLKTMKPKNIIELAIINAAIRPAGASYRDKLVHREYNVTSNPDVDKALSETMSFMVFQEQIMSFLVQFCGFTGSESDNIRRQISAKDKAKIDALVPVIIDGYCQHRDLLREKAEKEAQEYVKVIQDASAYAFNKSHAVCYSMLGYEFAYYRYYHPVVFVTAFLNFANNENDIVNGTNLAINKGIRIAEPMFRHGRAQYTCDVKTNTIYKGMSAIKFINDIVPEELYALRDNHYDTFFDVLGDIANKTSLNARQLEILIKIDFFQEFGNAKFLMRYIAIFDKLKHGQISQVKKDSDWGDTALAIFARHSKETKSLYRIEDIKGILCEFNELLQSANIPDFSISDKIAFQQEYLGYINIATNNPEDIHKLYIKNVTGLVAKKGKQAGKVWAYVIQTHSIGRGKSGEFMISAYDYKFKLKTGSLITFNPKMLKCETYQERKQWWIRQYELCTQ